MKGYSQYTMRREHEGLMLQEELIVMQAPNFLWLNQVRFYSAYIYILQSSFEGGRASERPLLQVAESLQLIL